MKTLLITTWRYRFFITSSIKSELISKFIRSRLGGLWMILNPLAQVLIYAFILSSILAAKLPGIDNKYAYSIYLMAGIMWWSLFSEIVNRCISLFIDNSNILKKLSFPKTTLPLIVIGGALVNNLLLFVAIMIIFAVLGLAPSSVLIWIPVLMAITVTFAVGLGLSLGVLNVFIRDIGQIVPVAMQFLFWLTPVVYMLDIIPPQYRGWLVLNPLIPLVTAYQDVLLYGKAPNLIALFETTCFSVSLVFFSVLIFRKASSEMLDQL